MYGKGANSCGEEIVAQDSEIMDENWKPPSPTYKSKLMVLRIFKVRINMFCRGEYEAIYLLEA